MFLATLAFAWRPARTPASSHTHRQGTTEKACLLEDIAAFIKKEFDKKCQGCCFVNPSSGHCLANMCWKAVWEVGPGGGGRGGDLPGELESRRPDQIFDALPQL